MIPITDFESEYQYIIGTRKTGLSGGAELGVRLQALQHLLDNRVACIRASVAFEFEGQPRWKCLLLGRAQANWLGS